MDRVNAFLEQGKQFNESLGEDIAKVKAEGHMPVLHGENHAGDQSIKEIRLAEDEMRSKLTALNSARLEHLKKNKGFKRGKWYI